MRMRPAAALLLLAAAAALSCARAQVRYLGRELGALSQLHHGVRGRVYAVDSRTLYIHDFHYDGEGPAAFFYVGTSGKPSATGAARLRDERGGTSALRRYRGEGVTLSLPDGKTLKDVKWFAVWCDEYSVNFGDVSIPRDLEYPRPAKLGALRGVHGVSSDPVVVVDAQTLLVPNFSYDGEAPDAKFWVGRGDKPSPQGIRIPDENGKEAPLRKYDKKTIVLTLPGELTVFDIGYFAVWCEAFTVNFGHVALPPAQLANVPPSLKMLGVSPQSRNKALAGSTQGRSQSRRPIAHVDATTYRPPARLRIGAAPLTAVDAPALHASLHRRADSYAPPHQQLIQQDGRHNSPEQTKQAADGQPEERQKYEQYLQQQAYDKHRELQNQQYLQEEQLQAQQRQSQLPNQPLAQPIVVQQANHLQFQPNPLQVQTLQQIPLDQLSHEQLLYQQQLYEQQKQILQQQLQEQYREIQYRQQQEPTQYHLLPFQPEGSSGVTIQRSVDLDLVPGSGSQ